MPRLSISREDLAVIRDVLTDRMIVLDDTLGRLEAEGITREDERRQADELRQTWKRMNALVSKVVKAHG